MHSRIFLTAILVLSAGCTHQIRPTPEVPLPPASRFDADVVLLLTEELEAYESDQKNGFHTFFFHFGEATADGMVAVFENVFSRVHVQRGVGQAAAMTMVARYDSMMADYLAVPRVQAKGSTGALDTDIVVDVVVGVVDLSTGESTLLRGSGKEGFSVSATGSASTALSDALRDIQGQLIRFQRDRR